MRYPTFVESLRLTSFILSVFALGWLLGMARAYWRLLNAHKTDPDWQRTWVPRPMILLSTGMALIVCSLIWRSVQFYKAPFTFAQAFSIIGLVFLDLGLMILHRNITSREKERQARYPREIEHRGA